MFSFAPWAFWLLSAPSSYVHGGGPTLPRSQGHQDKTGPHLSCPFLA